MPATDLAADLITDASTAPATTEFEATFWAQLGRLRTAAQTAGLHLSLGCPDGVPGGERLPLGDADEATARELAAILNTASATGPTAAEATGIAGTAAWLRTCATVAGIELRLGVPRSGADGRERLPLGDADHATTMRLADLIEQHLSDLYTAEDELRSALETIGVSAEQLASDDGAINLGDVTIAEGVVLLRRLAPDHQAQEVDPDDQHAGEELARRLADAVKEITGGRFIVAYTPYCRNCHDGPALLLGKLRPHSAQALTAHLIQVAA